MSGTVKLNHCPKCGAVIPAGAPQGLCFKCVMACAAAGVEAGALFIAIFEIPSLQLIAAAFPQLQILELIGRGGMGFVFKARQPRRWCFSITSRVSTRPAICRFATPPSMLLYSDWPARSIRRHRRCLSLSIRSCSPPLASGSLLVLKARFLA